MHFFCKNLSIAKGACDDHRVTANIRSLVRVINPNDRHCLARAVLMGIHHWRSLGPDGGGMPAFRAYCEMQWRHGPEARNLLRRAGISRRKQLYDMNDAQQLQQWLNGHFGRGQLRLIIVQKEAQYRIIFKGAGDQNRAANFNICLLLEREHFSYIARLEQLFSAHQYCVDCEHAVSRWHHFNECPVVCRMCLRYGRAYPCQSYVLPNGQKSSIRCDVCKFVFANQNCYQWHLRREQEVPMDGRGRRQFRSVCQMRHVCNQCGGIVYLMAGPHICRLAGGQRNRPQQCVKCKGVHAADDACFIQPLQQGEQQQSDDDDDVDDNQQQQQQQNVQARRRRRRGQKPLRLCFFDIETSQEEQIQLPTHTGQKHVPLLVIAEIICDRCINSGIGLGVADLGRRAVNCVCGTPTRGALGRQWCSPPFRNGPGDDTRAPEMAFNPRRYCSDIVDQS